MVDISMDPVVNVEELIKQVEKTENKEKKLKLEEKLDELLKLQEKELQLQKDEEKQIKVKTDKEIKAKQDYDYKHLEKKFLMAQNILKIIKEILDEENVEYEESSNNELIFHNTNKNYFVLNEPKENGFTIEIYNFKIYTKINEIFDQLNLLYENFNNKTINVIVDDENNQIELELKDPKISYILEACTYTNTNNKNSIKKSKIILSIPQNTQVIYDERIQIKFQNDHNITINDDLTNYDIKDSNNNNETSLYDNIIGILPNDDNEYYRIQIITQNHITIQLCDVFNQAIYDLNKLEEIQTKIRNKYPDKKLTYNEEEKKIYIKLDSIEIKQQDQDQQPEHNKKEDNHIEIKQQDQQQNQQQDQDQKLNHDEEKDNHIEIKNIFIVIFLCFLLIIYITYNKNNNKNDVCD